MKNAISYSLFGYEQRHENCYDFKSYLRYFTLVIRMNKLLYPDFENVLHIDSKTLNSEFNEIFKTLEAKGWVKLVEQPNDTPLCKAMLWRLKPAFIHGDYDVVLCRDLDSLACYKERAAVYHFQNLGTKTVHAMTDSVSHTIALMGGMIGVKSDYIRERVNANTWDDFMRNAKDINFTVKGSDQDFLNRFVLPKVSDSMVEHYFLGMPQSFRGECYVGQHIVDNIKVPNLKHELRESNLLVNHIGQAGFITEPVLNFFNKFGVLKNEIWELESKFNDVFYWTK